MGRRAFAVHRVLGAIIGIQLLAWSLGGFVFATHSISWVRGEDGRREPEPTSLVFKNVTISPIEAARRAGRQQVEEVVLRTFRGRPVYELRGNDSAVLVDGENGAVLSPISRDFARAVAVDDRRGDPGVEDMRLIRKDPPSEYRGGELPAWRVALDDSESTHIYVSASSGRVTARRNDAWRRFDFFWMLHTMDYGGRDNFNHPLLIAASGIAMLSVLSGAFLWALRVRRRLRSRRDRG